MAIDSILVVFELKRPVPDTEGSLRLLDVTADCGRFSICYTGRQRLSPAEVAADCGRFSICYTRAMQARRLPSAADCGRFSICYTDVVERREYR